MLQIERISEGRPPLTFFLISDEHQSKHIDAVDSVWSAPSGPRSWNDSNPVARHCYVVVSALHAYVALGTMCAF